METEAKRLPAVMKEAFTLLRQARQACQPSLKLEQIGTILGQLVNIVTY